MAQFLGAIVGRLAVTVPLKQKIQPAWNFDYYFRTSRMLSSAEPGDLVFFGKITSSDAFEQAVINVVPGNMFHVAIVKDNTTVVHAAAEGVVEEPLDDVIAKQEPHYVEVCRVRLPPAVKVHALMVALQSLGAAYNDLFTPDCINSRGQRAFYCSQLITEAYTGENMQFPEHKLQFGSGETLKYWERFYEERGRKIPLDEPGSHPSQLRRSPQLEQLAIRDFRKTPAQ